MVIACLIVLIHIQGNEFISFFDVVLVEKTNAKPQNGNICIKILCRAAAQRGLVSPKAIL